MKCQTYAFVVFNLRTEYRAQETEGSRNRRLYILFLSTYSRQIQALKAFWKTSSDVWAENRHEKEKKKRQKERKKEP